MSGCIQNFVTRYPQRLISSQVEDDLYIMGDPFLLQISVNNLLENALKYSPKETTVTLLLSKQNDFVQLEVQDNGPGIEDAYKKKVFEKFYRLGNEATKRAKGTGLGLYLTKKIVDSFGGHIFIKNNSAGGSNFTVQLKSIV